MKKLTLSLLFSLISLIAFAQMFNPLGSLVGILLAQQFILAKALPLPKFTEEDYKAAAREMAGKKVIKKSANVGKVRSLHHIDDEDYETPAEQPKQKKKSVEEAPKEGIASLVDTAPVKKDEDTDKVAEENKSEETENVTESAETSDEKAKEENND